MSDANRTAEGAASAEGLAESSPEPTEGQAASKDAEGAEASAEGGQSLLELLLAHSEGKAPALASRIDGVVVGHLVAIGPDGVPHVTFAGAPKEGFAARTMVPVAAEDVGRELALLFEGGNPHMPLVMGKIVSPIAPSAEPGAVADGQRVEINAEQEIVLRCGDASITLTRAGKILIRGAYVLTRSSGVNRIQGGSVEIN